MANKFNFQAKLGLDSKEFRKGVRGVQASLNGLKSSFRSFAAGLGATLGLERLVSSLKDTATKLNVAKTTLENASKVTKKFSTSIGEVDVSITNYQQNLAFIKRLSSEYGQDMVALIDNFAKFTASSRGTNLSLEQQKYIFEALTRAAAAYHLSADRTTDMLNAVNQMMSKGKVTAEELRRQLGNTLPGAFNIMAAAVGVSTSELDKMMKNGEIIAEDVLPKFAETLNKITANAHFDSLQTSMNQLKNEWYEFVELTGAENVFKGLIDTSTSALDSVGKHFHSWAYSIIAVIVSLFAGPKVIKGVMKGVSYFKDYRIRAEAEIAKLGKRMDVIGKSLKKQGFKPQGMFGYSVSEGQSVSKENLEDMLEYNNLLRERLKLQRSIKGEIGAGKQSKTVKRQSKAIEEQIKLINKQNRALLIQGNTWKKVQGYGLLAVRGIGKGIMNALKGLNAMLGPIGWIMLAFEGIAAAAGWWAGEVKKVREEEERIAGIQGNLNNRVNERMAPTNEQIKRIKDWKRLFDDFQGKGDKVGAQLYFGKLQGEVPALRDLTYEDLSEKAEGFEKLNAAIENYINNIGVAANAESLYDELDELHGRRETLSSRKTEIEKSGEPLSRKGGGSRSTGDLNMYDIPTDLGKEYNSIVRELTEVEGAIKTVNDEISGLKLKDGGDIFGSGKNDPDPEETPIQKVYREDKKALKALKQQYKEGGLTVEEYADKVNDLARKSYADAAETGAVSMEKIEQKLKNGKTLTTIEKFYKELVDRATTAIIMEGLDELAKEIEKEAEKELEKVEKLLEKQRGFYSKMQSGEYAPEKVNERFRGFDYKKSSGEIAGEEYDVAREKADNLDDAINKLKEDLEEAFGKGATNTKLKQMQADLVALEKAATSWQEAMRLEEMMEDLNDLEKELKELNFSMFDNSMGGISNFVTSVDNVINSFQRLEDVMENKDSSIWDQFIASFEVFESIMSGVITTMQTFNTIMELTNSLKEISAKKQALLNSVEMQGNALTVAGAAAKSAAAGAATANAAATGAEAAAAASNTAAKTGEAIANATASGAKMPFPLNLLAIAAGVAAVVAALSSISKFESGGVIGGSSTKGDHNLIRANSGEMVLNKAQQGTLFNAIKSGNLGGGGGEWRVRGTDLIKVIDNTRSKIKG